MNKIIFTLTIILLSPIFAISAIAKGTGLISKQDKDRQIYSRVISIDSPERREIEALLDRLISDSPQETLRER